MNGAVILIVDRHCDDFTTQLEVVIKWSGTWEFYDLRFTFFLVLELLQAEERFYDVEG